MLSPIGRLASSLCKRGWFGRVCSVVANVVCSSGVAVVFGCKCSSGRGCCEFWVPVGLVAVVFGGGMLSGCNVLLNVLGMEWVWLLSVLFVVGWMRFVIIFDVLLYVVSVCSRMGYVLVCVGMLQKLDVVFILV
jgi:hypothetical protein